MKILNINKDIRWAFHREESAWKQFVILSEKWKNYNFTDMAPLFIHNVNKVIYESVIYTYTFSTTTTSY